VIDQNGRVIRGDLLDESGNLFCRPQRQQLGAALRAQFAEGLDGELRIALDQDVERCVALALREFGEDLRQVRGVLLLQQIQQIRRRAHAQQALH
jgi:hypothetical protein